MGLALLHGDGGAADLHTALAANALVCVYLQRRLVLNVFQQGAGPAADDEIKELIEFSYQLTSSQKKEPKPLGKQL